MSKKNLETEQIWHNDGHKIVLRINKSELEVVEIFCPNDEKLDGECKADNAECIVRWFVSRYGMECNGGLCPAQENVEISWTLVGDIRNPDASQLWFMPLKDEIFQAWLVSRD